MNSMLLVALSFAALVAVGCASSSEKGSASTGVLRHVVLLKF